MAAALAEAAAAELTDERGNRSRNRAKACARWGFSSPSRFAAYSRDAYGVLPPLSKPFTAAQLLASLAAEPATRGVTVEARSTKKRWPT